MSACRGLDIGGEIKNCSEIVEEAGYKEGQSGRIITKPSEQRKKPF